MVPSVTELLNGSARIDGVRDPRISDLLGRRPVRTDVAAIAGYLTGKRVLVTGAGGSIGSELCRQLHRFGPAELIMLDRDESALHAVQLSIDGRALLDSTRPSWPTSATRAGSARCSRSSARRSSSTPPRSSTSRCWSSYPAEALKTNVWGTLHGAGGRRRLRGRVVRQHLHRQGRRSGERARLLQADRRAAHRAHGRPGRRHAT